MAEAAAAFKVRLEPEDEYTHTPDAASNYNESMYFNVFDPQKREIWFGTDAGTIGRASVP